MGKFRKIIGAFLHAPERFDMLAERIAEMNRKLDQQTEALSRRVDNLEKQGQAPGEWDGSAGTLRNGVSSEMEWIHRRIDSVEAQMDSISAGRNGDETPATAGAGMPVIPPSSDNGRILAEIREAAAARSTDEAIPAFGEILTKPESENGEPEKEQKA